MSYNERQSGVEPPHSKRAKTKANGLTSANRREYSIHHAFPILSASAMLASDALARGARARQVRRER